MEDEDASEASPRGASLGPHVLRGLKRLVLGASRASSGPHSSPPSLHAAAGRRDIRRAQGTAKDPAAAAAVPPPPLWVLATRVLAPWLEDVHAEAPSVLSSFPEPVRQMLVGYARRRGLLCDSLLLSLAEGRMESLDVSGPQRGLSAQGLLRAVAAARPRRLDVRNPSESLVADVCADSRAFFRRLGEACGGRLVELRLGGLRYEETGGGGGGGGGGEASKARGRAARTLAAFDAAVARALEGPLRPRLVSVSPVRASWEEEEGRGEASAEGRLRALRRVLWHGAAPELCAKVRGKWPALCVVASASEGGEGDRALGEALDAGTWSAERGGSAAEEGADETQTPTLAERFKCAYDEVERERAARHRRKRLRNERSRQLREAGEAGDWRGAVTFCRPHDAVKYLDA